MKKARHDGSDRRIYIGGGDVAAIMCVSPWRTPLDVWYAKTAEKPEEEASEPARFRRGRLLEPVALAELEQDIGAKVTDRNRFFSCGASNQFGGHVDGMVYGVVDHSVVEAKSCELSNRGEWGEPGSADVPEHYFCQGQWYMFLTGSVQCYYPVLFVGRTVEYQKFIVPRDDKFIGDMNTVVSHFWNHHVVGRIPPPPKTADDVRRLFPKASNSTINAGDLESEIVAYHQLAAKNKALESEMEGIKDQVIKLMGPNERLLGADGRVLAMFSNRSTVHIDRNALLERHPAVYAEVALERSSRALLFKQPPKEKK